RLTRGPCGMGDEVDECYARLFLFHFGCSCRREFHFCCSPASCPANEKRSLPGASGRFAMRVLAAACRRESSTKHEGRLIDGYALPVVVLVILSREIEFHGYPGVCVRKPNSRIAA